MPGRALRTLLPAWTVSRAIKLPPELLSPPGAGRKDSEGAGAQCCAWPGFCHQPGLCLALGTLERLCLELLLCQEEGMRCRTPTSPGVTPCSGGQERSCSPCVFALPSAFFFLLFFSLRLTGQTLVQAAPHATLPSADLGGNEAFAAKSDPCLLPQPLGARAGLAWPHQGLVFVVPGQPAPAPCSCPRTASTTSPRCLPFPGVGCPGGSAQPPSLLPPQGLQCK